MCRAHWYWVIVLAAALAPMRFADAQTIHLGAEMQACPQYPVISGDEEESIRVNVGAFQRILKAVGVDWARVSKVDPGLIGLTIFVTECISISRAQESDDWKAAKLRQAGLDLANFMHEHKSFLIIPDAEIVPVALIPVTPLGDTGQAYGAAREWQTQWFHPDRDTPIEPNHFYHVIVSSPTGASAAQAAMYRYFTRYPDMYFELWKTVNKETYAITVGTGLSYAEAKRLVHVLAQRGITNPQPFIWRSPKAV
jgi:hypothetical protein